MSAINRYAILLDGEFVRKKLGEKLKRFPTANDVKLFCDQLAKSKKLTDYELYRVYFYTADPLSEVVTNPLDSTKTNFSKTKLFSDSQRLISQLELSEDVSVWRGELVFHGWRLGRAALKNLASGPKRSIVGKDLDPSIEQKGVDMRIGLDIAALALKEIVATIVLVTSDSDMVPAMKFARREGLRVFLSTMGHSYVRNELKVHADAIL